VSLVSPQHTAANRSFAHRCAAKTKGRRRALSCPCAAAPHAQTLGRHSSRPPASTTRASPHAHAVRARSDRQKPAPRAWGTTPTRTRAIAPDENARRRTHPPRPLDLGGATPELDRTPAILIPHPARRPRRPPWPDAADATGSAPKKPFRVARGADTTVVPAKQARKFRHRGRTAPGRPTHRHTRHRPSPPGGRADRPRSMPECRSRRATSSPSSPIERSREARWRKRRHVGRRSARARGYYKDTTDNERHVRGSSSPNSEAQLKARGRTRPRMPRRGAARTTRRRTAARARRSYGADHAKLPVESVGQAAFLSMAGARRRSSSQLDNTECLGRSVAQPGRAPSSTGIKVGGIAEVRSPGAGASGNQTSGPPKSRPGQLTERPNETQQPQHPHNPPTSRPHDSRSCQPPRPGPPPHNLPTGITAQARRIAADCRFWRRDVPRRR